MPPAPQGAHRALVFNRWVALGASGLLLFAGGFGYSLSARAAATLRVGCVGSLRPTEALGAAHSLGGHFGLFGGACFDRYGPRTTILAAVVIAAGSYGALFALDIYNAHCGDGVASTFAGSGSGSAAAGASGAEFGAGGVGLAAALLALAGAAVSSLQRVALCTAMLNFPNYRATVTGLGLALCGGGALLGPAALGAEQVGGETLLFAELGASVVGVPLLACVALNRAPSSELRAEGELRRRTSQRLLMALGLVLATLLAATVRGVVHVHYEDLGQARNARAPDLTHA